MSIDRVDTTALTIDRVDLWGIRIPYTHPIKFFIGTRTHGDYVVLKITTSQGAYGIGGSGALWPVVSGENLYGAIQKLEEYFIPHALIGQNPFNINAIIARMDRLCDGSTMAKSVVDFTLHDLMGRVCNVPVYQLLGGAQRDEIPQEWIVMLGEPEAVVENALKYVAHGYSGIKFKWGGDVKKDIETTRQLRKALGEDFGLCVDANQCYTADQAIKVINATEEYNLKFVEQPVKKSNYDGYVRIRQHCHVPIAADETAWTVHNAWDLLSKGLVDYLHGAPSRTGGLVKLRQYLAVGSAANIETVYSIYNSPALEYAASAHFSFAAPPKKFPDEIVGIFNVHDGFSTDDIKEGVTDRVNPVLRKGILHKPDGVGFGMELNMEYVNRHTLHHKTITAQDRK